MATRKNDVNPLSIGQVPNTPLGDIWIATSPLGLASVSWAANQHEFEAYLDRRFNRPAKHNPSESVLIREQLEEYLAGQRQEFTIPIDWTVLRPFQQIVLQTTFKIPYGQTRTYKELAEEVSLPRAARAIGRVQATNPMPLVIPCHRVIGSDRKLKGYGGGKGLPTKQWLLKLEGALIA
ncbi:MAG: methylated-DNA--[protein]-cysteine S-methyltransferase [Anaerolineales bacterium]|nr:methylated-DNA--[protein]-cysteine S-methyltransferase [Anaerolineales bacterium]